MTEFEQIYRTYFEDVYLYIRRLSGAAERHPSSLPPARALWPVHIPCGMFRSLPSDALLFGGAFTRRGFRQLYIVDVFRMPGLFQIGSVSALSRDV